MKLKTKLKTREREEEGSSLYGRGGTASWAETDSSKFSSLAKQSMMESRRAPEFWVNDGESRLIRFVDQDAVVSFRAYRLKVGGRWRRFVAPAEGEPDLFASQLDMRPQQVFVFRVIDIEGYTNKKGKRFANQPRFLVAPTRMYDQIRMVAREFGEPLNSFNIKMSRSGQGTNTTYMFMPKPGPMTTEMKKALATFPKWKEYYAPTSLAIQKQVVSGHSTDDEDND